MVDVVRLFMTSFKITVVVRLNIVTRNKKKVQIYRIENKRSSKRSIIVVQVQPSFYTLILQVLVFEKFGFRILYLALSIVLKYNVKNELI